MNILLQITYSVSITDVIQTIGVTIGFPAALWSVVSLFRKDKNREMEVSALRDMAISQNSMISKMDKQVDELSRQTQQFEYQSMLLAESNELLRKQLSLQNEGFTKDQAHKDSILSLEVQRRKQEILPYFSSLGGEFTGTQGKFRFKNFGERAYYTGAKFIGENPDYKLVQPETELTLEKSQQMDVSVIAFNNKPAVDIKSEFYLLFRDVDGNKYRQKFIVLDKYSIARPEEIQE